MRKFIISFFAFAIGFLFVKSISTSSYYYNVSSSNAIKLGDVNFDGKINSQDYIMIRKSILKQIILIDKERIAADVNSDSVINAKDYITVKKIILNNANSTPTPTAVPTPKPTPTPTPKPTATPAPSLTISRTSLSLDGGDSSQLTVSVSPSNSTITWTSSNPRVASVDSKGKVTGNSAGTSTITATASNGKKASCTVTVSLNITYHEVRYKEGDNSGTTIWYAIIPSKYKMHYVFGSDKIYGVERPSDVAKRVNATIAVNSQILGFPIINGTKYDTGINVSGYDFTIKQNPNFKMYDVNTPPWDALIVTATKDYSQGISFKDINLGYDYEGDHVKHNPGLFMTLYAQIIMNGQYPNKFNPVSTGTEYYKRYYTQQETRQHERVPRTWIAYDASGNQFVAVATGRDYPLKDGTRIGQAGLTYHEMIKVTQKYFTTNIVTLYNMDGGGSATFVYKGEKLNGNGDVDAKGNRYERELYGTLYW